MPQPSTIEQVIAHLGDIVDETRRTHDRRGLFAALYRRTTIAVRDGIVRGQFEDADRMEALDVTFAKRYFDAWDASQNGTRPTRPWAYAFDVAVDDRPAAVQHLLLGVNAHISLDLAISACETAPGNDLAALRSDFFEINRVLAGMVDAVQEDLNRFSPLLTRIDRLGGPVDEAVATFALTRLRSAAWRKAVRFAEAPESARPRFVERWERQVESTSRSICPPPRSRPVLLPHPGHGVARVLGGVPQRDVAAMIAAIA